MASSFRTSLDSDRILTVTFDLPDKPVNILSSHVLKELEELIGQISRDFPRGVIFTSIKPRSFVAGADIVEMQKMNRPQLDAYLALGQSIFDRMSRLHMPTAAAINGDALGGGLELALACGWRIAADERSIQIGLPEARLGLVPGFGGTVRLSRLIGLGPALDMIMQAQTVPPREALKLGIVDEVVPRDGLVSAARQLLLSKPLDHPNSRIDRSVDPVPQERNQILDEAEYKAEQRWHGQYPAPVRLIGVIRKGFEHGHEAALAAERKALTELIEGPVGRNLMRLFFLRQGAKKVAAEQAGAPPLAVKRAAVIGGGTMGSGIAHGLIRAGIDVHLIEANNVLANAASARVRKLLADDLASGRIDEAESQRAGAMLHVQDHWRGIELADMVIEAVAEDMNVKREVFTRLDREARKDAILASNTSSLSLTTLAACTSRPQSVMGMHFFNPVPKMPLLEIVRTAKSSPQAIATGVALGARLGKAPFIANDAPGFVVNGVLIPYFSEALHLIEEGVPIDVIDRAMLAWGWPMGPLILMDHIGLDVCVGIFKAMAPSRGPRIALPRGLEEGIQRGWLGRKSGRGFYVYDPNAPKGTPPSVNQEIVGLLVAARSVPIPTEDQIQWRLMLIMANEAAYVLGDHVVDSPDSIDLAVLLGLGMGSFRGGLLQWCDSVGTRETAQRLTELAKSHGPRFTPAPLLADLAKGNRPFSDLRR
ncbi:MAG TPA: FAD-dependent oxidoreductase [Tepidisphaeraceae bacterium]